MKTNSGVSSFSVFLRARSWDLWVMGPRSLPKTSHSLNFPYGLTSHSYSSVANSCCQFYPSDIGLLNLASILLVLLFLPLLSRHLYLRFQPHHSRNMLCHRWFQRYLINPTQSSSRPSMPWAACILLLNTFRFPWMMDPTKPFTKFLAFSRLEVKTRRGNCDRLKRREWCLIEHS